MWYFEFEKERMNRKRIAETTKGVGRPKVGGPFELIDQNGEKFTSEMMHGKHSLVSKQTEADTTCDESLTRSLLSGLLWIHSLPRHLPGRA